MKILLVGIELFHAEDQTRRDGQSDKETDRHEEANSRFPQFFERTQKNCMPILALLRLLYTEVFLCANKYFCSVTTSAAHRFTPYSYLQL